MSRVIQDSDDDLDDDLDLDVHQPQKTNASPKQSTSDASSTEALRRQIEAAHRAHLQSECPTSDKHLSTPAQHIDEHKRKLPREFDLDNTPGGIRASVKGPVTYSKKSKGMYSSSSAGHNAAQEPPHQELHFSRTVNNADWLLEGTMLDAFVQHDNAMFPEPSSTVPNATLTQQRVLEGVLAPALLGSDIDTAKVSFQSDASIPWSEYLKSPTDAGEQPRSSAYGPQVSLSVSAPAPDLSLQEDTGATQVQQNRQGSLVLVGSPLEHNLSTNDFDAQDGAIPLDNSVEPDRRRLQNPSLSTLGRTTRDGLQSSHSESLHRKQDSVPLSDNDLADDVGLPKEQYKPRPSRSRSLNGGPQDSIGSSIRPEKATRASKRRRTTTTITATTKELVHPTSTPEKIQQICDMGFTPSTTGKALKQNNGDVTQTVDWLITHKVADDELVSHTSQTATMTAHPQKTNNSIRMRSDPQRDHGNADQTVSTDTATEPNATSYAAASADPDDIALEVHTRGSARVQVLIPAKSPKAAADEPATTEAPRKKAKHGKAIMDQQPTTIGHDAVLGSKTEKKRGRGRPKKIANTPVPMEAIQNVHDEALQAQSCHSPLQSVDANHKSTTMKHGSADHTLRAQNADTSQEPGLLQIEDASNVTNTSKSTPEPPLNRPEVSPITPERAKTLAPREQPTNNKAKVSYRVGLSKRARIAPLLRTRKK